MKEEDFEKATTLFELQDMNKRLKFNATNEDQIEAIKRVDDFITKKLNKLYVCD